MQELFVDTAACRDEQGSRHVFRYYILSELIEAGTFTCENFGVKIESAEGEAAEIRGITPNRTRLEQLMSLLIRNTVTPVELPYVVQDWL